MLTTNARRTIWFDDKTPPVGPANATPDTRAISASRTAQSAAGGESKARRDGEDRHEQPRGPKITIRDPWTIYTHKALVRAGHEVSLAIRRDDPAEIVHIQMTRADLTQVKEVVQKISRVAHRGFLRLLDVLHYRSTSYFVWEPAEFALDCVLFARCRIQEDELGHIIRPILEGIKYLCDHGLVPLGKDFARDHVVITQAGEVKLYGVERCYPINQTDINAATLRLTDLRDIVGQLTRRNRRDYDWSDDVLDFATRLDEEYSDGHLEKLLEHPLLRCDAGHQSLRLLVNLVNKTAIHRVACRPLPAPLG